MYGTGRVGEIISAITGKFRTELCHISIERKLQVLCDNLDCSFDQFDTLISNNTPVLRTVKGHAFEIFFDKLLRENGYKSEEVGGDTEIDRLVNGYSLQLKTPTLAGTKGNIVQYKTHKTHGAKSEKESLDYYHSIEHFADFLVGLVSYEPLKILVIDKNELPTHHKDSSKIISPFSVDYVSHKGFNAFDRIGVNNLNYLSTKASSKKLLPRTSQSIGVDDEIIIDTILNEQNFRIWDMSIRGFAREQNFKKFLKDRNIAHFDASKVTESRPEKADGAFEVNDRMYLYQMKGVSTNNCKFDLDDPIIATETQLTRGRVNDHPTQSRLYLVSDFTHLVLAIDPAISLLTKLKNNLEWTFIIIPSHELENHKKMPHRYASLQKFRLSHLRNFIWR